MTTLPVTLSVLDVIIVLSQLDDITDADFDNLLYASAQSKKR